jgi:hypothetical protein
MHFNSNHELLQHLHLQLRELQSLRNELSNLSPSFLTLKPSADSWSANECLIHLNNYGDFYLPELIKGIEQLPKEAKAGDARFRSGWLGNKFINMMKIQNNGKPKKKMKSPADKLPMNNLDVEKNMKNFDAQLLKLDKILQKSSGKNLGNIRISISLSRFIQLKVGDVLQFYMAHHLRHLHQAIRASIAK